MTNFYNNGTPLDNYLLTRSLFSQGGIWMVGENVYGELGTNIPSSTQTYSNSPVQTISGGINWKQIGGGYQHVTGIKTDGTLWSWGRNQNGQLGTNDTTNRSSPVQTVDAATNWKFVSGGAYHTAGIKTDGTLWLWGQNPYGALGDNTRVSKSSPVQTVSSGNNWKLVSAGRYYTGAIKTDGTLWMWGMNSQGWLGTNDKTDYSSPVQTIAGGTNWKQLSCGYQTVAAIKTDGTLWVWGQNNYGELATNNVTRTSSPVQTISAGTNWSQVKSGWQFVAAIKTDGTLWTWGRNQNGQLGTNDTTNRSSPVQTVAGGTNWRQIHCGFGLWMGGIKTDGTLWTWGNNGNGQLGIGSFTNKSSPVQIYNGGTNWKSIAGGYYTNSMLTDIF